MGLLGFAAYAIALDVEKLSQTEVRVFCFMSTVSRGDVYRWIASRLGPRVVLHNETHHPTQARSEAFAVIFLVQCFHAFMSRSIRNSLITSGASLRFGAHLPSPPDT